MTEEELKDKLETRFGATATVTVGRARRVFARVSRENLKPVLRGLKDELGYYHLSTITGLDSGENLEALYHLTDGNIELTVRTAAPKADPHLPTITGIIAGAILYERELQDMFGFVIDGIPDPRRYLLPEDWPQGAFPLRKDYEVVPRRVNAGD
jgi:NADH:ubiquinone oxidoreductase subunit C